MTKEAFDKIAEGRWELYWPKGEPPADIVNETRKDVEHCLKNLEKAEDLIFHTVFLGDDYATCPIVAVDGKPGDHRLHCTYYPK